MPLWNRFNTHRFTNSQSYTQCSKTSMFRLLKYPKLPAAYIRHGFPQRVQHTEGQCSGHLQSKAWTEELLYYTFTLPKPQRFIRRLISFNHIVFGFCHIYLRGNSDLISYLEFRPRTRLFWIMVILTEMQAKCKRYNFYLCGSELGAYTETRWTLHPSSMFVTLSLPHFSH